ncbi:hypothetical protein EYB53_004605 [Candidatus Chloroploca sp. M-50]|uniref:Glycosyltransferase RgtA/B/C/D-like domain-containing protein n=1 Tax=Candidatus Chloroploca mongolica TaxID=2528176 RepID=A0ABS4D6C3_9CHLR|nr:hypothetical protein [Candidatus Chloroploca mongolica]MBP1464985.1 hypothetical protein [Candidatus Chloroploca mongolica]
MKGFLVPAGLLVVALTLWIFAYQVPFRQVIHVGGDVTTQRRFDDQPFLLQVNGSEPADRVADPEQPEAWLWWWEVVERTGGRSYRWTTAESTLLVPGIGGQTYLVELVAGGQPGGVVTTWETGRGLGTTLFLPEGDPRRYQLLASTERNGDLRITMRTPPFEAPGDRRELGFVLYDLRLQGVDQGLHTPAWPQLLWLSVALLALYVWVLAAGAGLGGAVALTSLAMLAAAATLIWQRPALTLFTSLTAQLALIGATATLLAAWAARRLGERHLLVAGLAPVVGLVTAAFALRMAGMLHPHALYSDTMLQANKLFEASLGQIFMTAGLPTATGGGVGPYPPAPFLIMMPAMLLVESSAANRVLVVQTGTAMLDSLVMVALWVMLRRAGYRQHVALLALTGYLLPVTALESFSVGELANLSGQALAIPLLLLLALGAGARPIGPVSRHAPALVSLLVVALAVALVAHSGVTLSIGAVMAVAWLIALLDYLRQRDGPFNLVRLSLVAACALGFVLIFYYTAPVYLASLRERGGGEGVSGMALSTIVVDTAKGILGLAPPGRRSIAIPFVLSLAALGGLALIWTQRNLQPRARALRATLLVWWAGTLLTQGLLLVADQGVRWGLFLYPVLCLSAGPLLGAFWQRGRAGRWVSSLMIAFIITYGMIHWIIQVRDYFHI